MNQIGDTRCRWPVPIDRLAMGSLAAALTGMANTTPSGLFDYISRVFGAQSRPWDTCQKHEDEDKGKPNGDLRGIRTCLSISNVRLFETYRYQENQDAR